MYRSMIAKIFLILCLFCGLNLFSHEFQAAYTREDMVKVQKEINAPSYIESVLPYDLSHMIALLSYNGTSEEMNSVYLRSVMKMYTNFAKQVDFFDADMVLQFLNCFSIVMTPIIQKNHVVPLLKQKEATYANMLYEQLFGSFSVQYNTFKEDPEQFLHNISVDIARGATRNGEYIELQQGIVRFLEQLLSKVLFDPTNHQYSWQVVNQIASTLSMLAEKNIVSDVNTLDDILVSLSSRYTHFLKMFSDTLPREFLTGLQQEISTKSMTLFAYDTNAIFGRKAQLSQTINECLMMNLEQGSEQIIDSIQS